jgi:hypothetical protein
MVRQKLKICRVQERFGRQEAFYYQQAQYEKYCIRTRNCMMRRNLKHYKKELRQKNKDNKFKNCKYQNLFISLQTKC